MEKKHGRTIGERIRFLRERSEISQEELAKDLKVAGGSVVSMYETGKRHLPTDLVLTYLVLMSSWVFQVSTEKIGRRHWLFQAHSNRLYERT